MAGIDQIQILSYPVVVRSGRGLFEASSNFKESYKHQISMVVLLQSRMLSDMLVFDVCGWPLVYSIAIEMSGRGKVGRRGVTLPPFTWMIFLGPQMTCYMHLSLDQNS